LANFRLRESLNLSNIFYRIAENIPIGQEGMDVESGGGKGTSGRKRKWDE
jgi:hypothetical protein